MNEARFVYDGELAPIADPVIADTGQTEIKMFKAKKRTHRFRQNQKVWVVMDFANHLWVVFKWRGNGRYIKGRMSKWNDSRNAWAEVIGDEGLKTVLVPSEFVNNLKSHWKLD